MAKTKYLKLGTMNCPDDKERLEWEQFAGMRIVKEQDGHQLYQARCPKCGVYWGVHAR